MDKQPSPAKRRKRKTVPSFTYECGCKGKLIRGTIPICCDSHGDLIIINGNRFNPMLISASVFDLIFEDAGIPGQLNFNR